MQLAAPAPKRKKRKTKAPVFTTVGDKEWLSHRLDEVGLSQREALKRLQMHSGSLSKRMSGDIRWKLDELIKLAGLLMVNVQQLMWKVGYSVSVPTTPVIGVVKHDARVWLVTERRDSIVPAISDDLTIRALLFEIEKGPLRGYDGHALHYRPCRVVQPEAMGALSVIELASEPTPVVGTMLQSKGKVCVTLLTGEVVADVRVLTAAPVEGIRRP